MISLGDLASSKTVVKDLDVAFDFAVVRPSKKPARKPAWITLSPAVDYAVVAGDAAGGVYLAYGDGPVERRPILFATSEGQAGRIADDLTGCLAMFLAIPYWRDLLKFSGGGRLDEMRKAVPFMKREFETDCPNLPAARARLLAALPIPTPDDPVRGLHEAVHATDCTLLADDGSPWASLFNTFVSADNPHWRGTAT